MKIVLFSLILLSAVPVMAQSRANVQLTVKAPECPEFESAFNNELHRFDTLYITTRKLDFDVYVVATPLRDDDGKLFGYAAATLVVRKAGGRDEYLFDIHIGKDSARLGRRVAGELNEKYFQQRRRK